MKHEQSPPASTMNHASGPDLVKLIECERVHAHLPALLAAWAPPLAAIGLSLGMLLHHEDG